LHRSFRLVCLCFEDEGEIVEAKWLVMMDEARISMDP